MTFAPMSKSKTKPVASGKRAAKHKLVPNRSVVESLPGLGVLGVRSSVATPIIQPKLKIGAPNDKFEQEADRVADQVMRMPDSAVTGAAGLNEAGQSSHQSPGATPPFLQRQCSKCATEDETRLQRSSLPSAVKPPQISALNGPLTAQFQRLNLLGSESQPVAISEQTALPQIQRLCSECDEQLQRQPVEEEDEELLQAKEMPNGTPQVSSNLSNQIDSMRGGGQPLPKSVRAFVEPRLGQDFSHVRIHTGSKATESAEALNARAYTVGQQIVFGKGQYVPETAAGKRLLAHELVHITQQNQTIHNSQIQRTCNPGPIAATVGTRSGCNDRFDGTFVSGSLFKFNSECDTFQPGVDLVLRGFALALPPTTTFEIHGFASTDGPVDFNQNLGCARALAAQKLLTDPPALGGAGIAPSRITGVINHGPVPGPIADRRSVVILTSTPAPPPPPPPPPPPSPTVVKPGVRTPCERNAEFDFQDCLQRSRDPLSCLAQRNVRLGSCVGTRPTFEVCVRLLQPPVEISGCNHAYVETPTHRYAIITPCTSQLSFAEPIFGGVALKTDRSPDPCLRRPTCINCVPRPGVTDLESCFRSEFTAYAGPSLHRILGPNSNTFAGTLARACCDNMTPKPAAFGCLPGWDDPPAPARTAPCPSGSPVC